MKYFNKDVQQINKAMSTVTRRVAATALNFSKERFVRKNWVDTSPTPWEARKTKNNNDKRNKKKSRAILVETGRLKKSVRIIQMTPNKIVLGSDVTYARIHNEGGTISKTVKVRGHQRRTLKGNRADVLSHSRQMNTKIPKRQFIGVSAILERRVEREIDRTFNEHLNP